MLTARLNKIRELSRDERRLLLQAVLLLPLIYYALLLVGYSRLVRLMELWVPIKSINGSVSNHEVLERAQVCARIVAIATQYGPYKATWLRRSLLVWAVLRKEGIQGEICIGARTIARQLEAHTWVEYNGIVLNDSPEIHDQYPALREVPPPTSSGL